MASSLYDAIPSGSLKTYYYQRRDPIFICSSPEELKNIIEEGTDDVNVRNSCGQTPIFNYLQSFACTKVLIDSGADVNAKDKFGETCIFYCKNVEVINLLAKNGADMNVINKEGKTALFYTLFSPNYTKALIENGADVTITDKDGKTALFHTLHPRLFDHMKVLIEDGGADVNSIDNKGRSLLFYSQSSRLTKALLELGADTKVVDKKGYTPLTYGIRKCVNENVITLLSKATDVIFYS